MSRGLPYAVRCVLVAAVYFALARVGLHAAVTQHVVSSAWPPAGFALATLFLLGPRLWPGVLIGALAANISAGAAPGVALLVASGNTLEALAGCGLLRLAGFDAGLRRVRDVVALATLGAIVAPLIGAAMGSAALTLTGAEPLYRAPLLALVWWSGDALGILVVAPLLCSWWSLRRSGRVPRPPLEALVLLLVVVSTLTLLLLRSRLGWVYMVFPAGMWAALRFGPRGASAITAVVAVLSVAFTVGGSGPFTGSSPAVNLLLLQVFLGMFAVSTLLLAAAVASHRRAEQRFRTLTELAPDMIFQVGADGTIAATNAEFATVLGWERADWLGRRVTDLLHPDDRAEFSENLQRVLRGALPSVDLNRRLRHREGHYVRVEGRALPLVELGRIVGVLGEVHDVSERLRVEEDLRDSRRRLRALSRRLLGSHEEERTRLARELHDQIGQALSAVMMSLEGLHRQGAEERRDQAALQDSIEMVEHAVEQVRTMSFDLRPALLDDLGLAAAIREFCRRRADAAGITLHLDIHPPGELPREIETVCYRVMQEAVTNVLRHAKAGVITVSLRDDDNVLVLTVCDDGCGFDPRPAMPHAPESHLGIVGMMERAELVGGRVELESEPGDGTTVRAYFPHAPQPAYHTPAEPLERVAI